MRHCVLFIAVHARKHEIAIFAFCEKMIPVGVKGVPIPWVVVFSHTPIGRACHEHIFSSYPQRLFESLDTAWAAYLRKVIGPGVGVCVPPLLACVLSRALEYHAKDEELDEFFDFRRKRPGPRRHIAKAFRDLRDEYSGSRRELWDHLDAMWNADSMREQL